LFIKELCSRRLIVLDNTRTTSLLEHIFSRTPLSRVKNHNLFHHDIPIQKVTSTKMSKILKVIFLAALASAAAIPSSKVLTRASGQSAVAMLLQIAPTSNSCAGASFPSECETAEQAAPFLIQAMETYHVTSSYEIAALLSLIAYESGDFHYDIHHFPSLNPGT
jgi:hypothetical protein